MDSDDSPKGEIVNPYMPRLRTPRQRRDDLSRKLDMRIPDEVWLVLQECGEMAAQRLHEILSSPKFARYRPHEQIRVIELALMRAYGSSEAVWSIPHPQKAGSLERNAISHLADLVDLPEFRNRPEAKTRQD